MAGTLGVVLAGLTFDQFVESCSRLMAPLSYLLQSLFRQEFVARSAEKCTKCTESGAFVRIRAGRRPARKSPPEGIEHIVRAQPGARNWRIP